MDSNGILIIRTQSPAHCARGEKRCAKCVELAKRREIRLLRVFFKQSEEEQQCCQLHISARDPLTGEKRWTPFRVEQIFANNSEAQEYAQRHQITDVKLDEEET